MEYSVIAFFFVLGALVGSFLNVLILRFGFSETASPRSQCPLCNHGISWFHLVPVFSFLALSGKCAHCGGALTKQYISVELLTGALFALSYFFFPPLLSALGMLSFIALLVFWSALVVLVVYDIRHTLIPLPFVFFVAASALVIRGIEAYELHTLFPIGDALVGALVVGGFFAGISIVTKGRGMGIGDAYVAGALVLLLGLVKGVEAATLGVWSAALFYGALYLYSKFSSQFPNVGFPQVTIQRELPFAPFLVFGAALALFTALSPFEAGIWLGNFLWLNQ